MAEEEVLVLKLKIESDKKNAKSINDLIKRNKDLAKFIKNAPKEGAEGYKELQKELESAKKEYAKNRQEIVKFNKELRTGEKEVEATEDSLKGLGKTLKTLEKEYKNLTAQERKTARGRELQKNIIKTRKELSKAEKGLGDYRRSVGQYTRSLVGLNSGIGSVAVSVGTLKDGLGGLVGAFRASGAAAKAFVLTLGPIAIAIGLIGAALSKFQSVVDSIKSTFSGIGAAFDVIVERIGRFGLAFGKLLTLDFSGFANDAKAAFEGLGDEIRADFEAATQLSNRLNQLRDREIASLTTLAQLQVDISEARRLSQEAEQTNRKEAIKQLDEAIALTRQRAAIEQSIAQERANILREQVNLSAETTSAEDRRELADAEVALITIEKRLNDEIRGLIRRRETLGKTNKKNNAVQLTELQKLQQEQSKLTESIKNQLLAGDDASANLERLAVVTAKLLKVEEEFKALTEGVTVVIKAQEGSLQAYNEEINKLTEELQMVNVESEEYARIQNEILLLETKRSAAIGDITTSIEALNEAQEANLAILEDAETELRLRNQAQAQIEALEGDAMEVAQRRVDIETQLQSDLKQLRVNRITDEQEILNEELDAVETNLQEELKLFADNELKKQELLLIAQGKRDEIKKRSLELEAELLKISTDKFNDAEKDKTKSAKEEEAKRKALRDLAIETSVAASQKILELLSVIQEQQTEKQLQEIQQREDAEIAEAELVGKTEEEKQAIRAKFEREREDLQKKAAVERKALALAEATIDIAGAVIKSLNSPPPANVALAASTAALGALQLAIIAATNFAQGGLVQPVQLEDGKIVAAQNIPALSNGDRVLATVKPGEVILNERQQQAVGGASTFRKIGVPGFARGGKVDFEPIAKASAFANGGMTARFTSPVMMAKAFQSGGLASLNVSQVLKKSIAAENQELGVIIEKAVARGAAIGSKQGIEAANIANQLVREQERRNQQAKNEDF